MTSSAVQSPNFTARRRSAVVVRTMRATVAASSASVNAVWSSYFRRSTTATLHATGAASAWSLSRRAADQTAGAGRGADLSFVVDDLAAQQHGARPAGDLPT